MKLHPIGGDGRVIVRRDPDVAQTAAGIIVPIILRKHDVTGEVVAVHSGVVRGIERAPLVRKGERVLFGKYSGTDVEHEGETLTIMPEDEILAVLE